MLVFQHQTFWIIYQVVEEINVEGEKAERVVVVVAGVVVEEWVVRSDWVDYSQVLLVVISRTQQSIQCAIPI
jgi:hypothetical protein